MPKFRFLKIGDHEEHIVEGDTLDFDGEWFVVRDTDGSVEYAVEADEVQGDVYRVEEDAEAE